MPSITNRQGNADPSHNEVVRYYLTPLGMAIIKKQEMTAFGKDWRLGENTCALRVATKTDTATMEDRMEIPQKIKNRTTI